MATKNKSLAFKLSAYACGCACVVLAVVAIYNYQSSRALLSRELEVKAENQSRAIANKLDQIFIRAADLARALAAYLENAPYSEAAVKPLIAKLLSENPDAYGMCLAFAPRAGDPQKVLYAPYFYKRAAGDIALNHELASESYNYPLSDWYQIPQRISRPIWTEPYFDEGGSNILMTTYSCPFFSGDPAGKRRFRGVVTVDISLSRLRQRMSELKMMPGGYGFIITRFGRVVSHPDPDLIMNQSIFTVAEERGDLPLRELGLAMIEGKSGFGAYRSILGNRRGWLYYSPLESCGWSMSLFFPEKALLAPIKRLSAEIAAISIAGLVVLLVAIVYVTRRATTPLRRLTSAAAEIGAGNFHVALPTIPGMDEIGQLTRAFERMRAALADYVENLKRTTAAKEKIESELAIAREIQLSIIPKLFPAFPERPEFEIYAALRSAKAVGGDLYDFFFLDDDHLCVSIGDVSGKGVPASLFMAVTQTLLRATAAKDIPVESIVGRVNKALCGGNDTSMFVTFFLAILNVKTGETLYCNAGHNPPYILRNSGDIEPLKAIHGIPLGVMDVAPYSFGETSLKKNETLVFYTDGVTEAFNADDEMFGDDRLRRTLLDEGAAGPETLIKNVFAAVQTFAGAREQSDDITVLALRFRG